MQLEGKVAIITGSTQGLGAAIARLYVSEGAKVVVTGRSREQGEAVAAKLGKAAIFQPSDLTRVEDCHALVDATVKAFGAVDILVNSAADTSRSNLETFTVDQFDRLFHINLRAPLLIAQRALPHLRKDNGAIINIGSVNSYMGLPNLLIYSATKGALMAVTKNLSNALQRARVRVYDLNVGWMDTEGERAILAKEGKPGDFVETAGKVMPLGRLLKPEEIADVCLLLASSKSAAFSGAVIDLEQFPVGAPSYPTGQG